jgi:hypothetical protein
MMQRPGGMTSKHHRGHHKRTHLVGLARPTRKADDAAGHRGWRGGVAHHKDPVHGPSSLLAAVSFCSSILLASLLLLLLLLPAPRPVGPDDQHRQRRRRGCGGHVVLGWLVWGWMVG